MNRAGAGSLVVPSEYLEIVITRRWLLPDACRRGCNGGSGAAGGTWRQPWWLC